MIWIRKKKMGQMTLIRIWGVEGWWGQDVCLNIEDEAIGDFSLCWCKQTLDVTLLKVSNANVSLCPVSEVDIKAFISFFCDLPHA